MYVQGFLVAYHRYTQRFLDCLTQMGQPPTQSSQYEESRILCARLCLCKMMLPNSSDTLTHKKHLDGWTTVQQLLYPALPAATLCHSAPNALCLVDVDFKGSSGFAWYRSFYSVRVLELSNYLGRPPQWSITWSIFSWSITGSNYYFLCNLHDPSSSEHQVMQYVYP